MQRKLATPANGIKTGKEMKEPVLKQCNHVQDVRTDRTALCSSSGLLRDNIRRVHSSVGICRTESERPAL
jgi:hypothetical protein